MAPSTGIALPDPTPPVAGSLPPEGEPDSYRPKREHEMDTEITRRCLACGASHTRLGLCPGCERKAEEYAVGSIAPRILAGMRRERTEKRG
jgi:hypothetical protein